MKATTCPGCGVALPDLGLEVPERFEATGECRAAYDALTAYHLTREDPDFHHQIAVDCYGAQHAGERCKPIGIVFSLVGLCLLLEHSYTGRRIQLAHTQLSHERMQWPTLAPLGPITGMTVQDVLLEEAGVARDLALYDWAASVWAGWRHEHERVRDICSRLLIRD
ncbi:DUF5946 family protein [Cohnella yongneupensis]|uniref:DUF5946 family protein n=1 Tax=Cohnella yongneupensis TaxID=425006 RepID=A0ABW0QZC0_9BACL